MTSSAWIDAHVHLFAPGAEGAPRLPGAHEVHTPAEYLRRFGSKKPDGIVSVHFSKAPDSQHVIDSLALLKKAGIPAAGVLKADAQEARLEGWLARPDVKAIRFYAKDSVPDLSAERDRWNHLFNLLRQRRQHLMAFGDAHLLPALISQLPEDLPLVIDHLGVPDITKGASDAAFHKLLSLMQARIAAGGQVFFKGPGYRTSLRTELVQPFVDTIAQKLGATHLMLGASDAPYAGPVPDTDTEWKGRNYADAMDACRVMGFTHSLAKHAAAASGQKEEAFLQAVFHDNAAKLYGFQS